MFASTSSGRSMSEKPVLLVSGWSGQPGVRCVVLGMQSRVQETNGEWNDESEALTATPLNGALWLNAKLYRKEKQTINEEE